MPRIVLTYYLELQRTCSDSTATITVYLMSFSRTITIALGTVFSICIHLSAQEPDATSVATASVAELRSDAAQATETGDHDRAIKLLQKAANAAPDDLDCQYDLAMAYFHADRMPQMWAILHTAANKAPSHPKISKALLAYWRMFDEQGLFNVGVPVSDITRMLGDPDQTATNGKRKRLMYGFMVVETKEDRVHQTLNLRGLTNEHMSPKEYIDVALDGKGRRVGCRSVTQYTTLAEFVLPNEKVQNWSELFSVQRLHGAAKSNQPIKAVAKNLLDVLAKSHPDRKFRFIDETEHSVLYEWKVTQQGDTPAQHELVRLFRGIDDVHRVAFVAKKPELSAEQHAMWVKILQSAKLVPIEVPPTQSK